MPKALPQNFIDRRRLLAIDRRKWNAYFRTEKLPEKLWRNACNKLVALCPDVQRCVTKNQTILHFNSCFVVLFVLVAQRSLSVDSYLLKIHTKNVLISYVQIQSNGNVLKCCYKYCGINDVDKWERNRKTPIPEEILPNPKKFMDINNF